MNIKKYIFITLILLGLICSIAFFFFHKPHTHDVIFYATESAQTVTITQQITATGTLKATDQFTVGSLIAGKVARIEVDDNDEVKKDQLLAIIDNAVHDTGVKKAMALLEQAEAAFRYQSSFFARQQILFKNKQVSQSQYEQYQRDYETAEALVHQRQAELAQEKIYFENLFIRAPGDGVIISKRVEIGQMITSQLQASVLFDIAHDLTDMEAWVDVDEADAGRLEAGQPATFTVDAFPKQKFFASVHHIQYLAKTIDNIVTYATILKVKNPEKKLRPGMTTNVTINVAHKENVLSVPNRALRINGFKLEELAKKNNYTITTLPAPTNDPSIIFDYVWRVDPLKRIITKQPVQLGINNNAYTEIIQGIDAATTIITEIIDTSSGKNFLKNSLTSQGGIGRS